jgi:hypothetical protein
MHYLVELEVYIINDKSTGYASNHKKTPRGNFTSACFQKVGGRWDKNQIFPNYDPTSHQEHISRFGIARS